MIRYHCARCRSLLESDDALAGKTEQCPLCKQENVIPQPRIKSKSPVIAIALIAVVAVGVIVGAAMLLSDSGDDGGPEAEMVSIDGQPDKPGDSSGAISDATRNATAEEAVQGEVTDNAATAELFAKYEALQKEVERLKQGGGAGGLSDAARAALIAKVSPAVFRLECMKADGSSAGGGSGFFISPDGLAVTNYHVLDGSDMMLAYRPDHGRYIVTGCYLADPDNDLAIIQVDAVKVPYLELWEGELPPRGTTVMTMGSPRGIDDTPGFGHISKIRLGVNGRTQMIQTDAPIAHGSSGGPMVAIDGRVIGINTWAITGEEGLDLNGAIIVDYLHAALAKKPKETQALASFHDQWSDRPSSGGGRGQITFTKNHEAALKAMMAGELQDALRILERAVRGDEADNGLTWFLLGKCYRLLHNYEEALISQSAALELLGRDPTCLVECGICFVGLSDYPAPEKILREAVQTDADYLAGWYDLATLCGERTDKIAAGKNRNTPTARKALARLKEFRSVAYAMTAKSEAKSSEDFCRQAKAFRALDEPKAAIECAKQAIGLAEEWPEPYRMLAEIAAEDLEDYQTAINAIALMMDRTGTFTAGDMFNLSHYATAANDHDLASGAYAKGIDTLVGKGYTVDHSRWYGFGRALCRSRNYREASQAFAKAVKSCNDEPKLGDYHLWLAYAQRKSGNITEALRNILIAGVKGIDDHETNYQLGLCFWADNQKERAKKHFQNCINADPNGPRTEEARKYLWQ